jgi:type I restriction enzyme S subunit
VTFVQVKEPWIGELPAEWGLVAIKRLVSTKITDGPHETPELDDDGVQFISAEAIKNSQIDFNLRRGFISQELHEQYSRKCRPKRGDIFVIKSGATTGNVACVDVNFEFSIWSPLAVIRCDERKAFYRFAYYVLLSDVFRKQVELSWSFGTQQNIGMGVIERLKLPIPPVPEQQRIAAYLDTSCAAIDAAVFAKRRQLKTLDALKRSAIFHAVTRGLSDSDSLKASGIDWLGEIPAHWTIRRIKDIAELRSGDAIQSEDIAPEGDYPVYGGNGLRGFTFSYTHNGQFALIGRQGALCGNINYADGMFWATEHAVVATLLRRYDTLWFGELLRAMNLGQYSNAAAQPGLAVDRIKFLRLPVPPPEEQTRIAEHVRTIIQQNESIGTAIQSQIATLNAYRKSLIHECVTGQRRITETDVARTRRSEAESVRR